MRLRTAGGIVWLYFYDKPHCITPNQRHIFNSKMTEVAFNEDVELATLPCKGQLQAADNLGRVEYSQPPENIHGFLEQGRHH